MTFSLILRRIHMYLALFLVPWILMYALSTMTMNHRDYIKQLYGGRLDSYEVEREITYTGTFPEDASRWMAAEQILSDLELEGTYSVRGGLDRGWLTIHRADPITPRRLNFTTEDSRMKIQRRVLTAPSFLEGLHRRRGFQHDFFLEDAWAFCVDLFIVGTIFWVASGLWMRWELKVTRRFGALCLVGGILLFTTFLGTI